jgi:hypothetical protein
MIAKQILDKIDAFGQDKPPGTPDREETFTLSLQRWIYCADPKAEHEHIPHHPDHPRFNTDEWLWRCTFLDGSVFELMRVNGATSFHAARNQQDLERGDALCLALVEPTQH